MWGLRWRRSQTGSLEVAAPPAWAFATDTGCRREINEDCVRVVEAGDGLVHTHGILAVVADGMGGHEAGEVASGLAVEVICREYFGHPGPPGEALAEAFGQAQDRIRAAGSDRGKGMGTTCTAAAVLDGLLYMAHVGDSRLYLVRGGGVFRMTEDHSAVMERVRSGEITAEQARVHNDRNILLRALGSPSWRFDSLPAPFPLRNEDCLVLCSDGLHGLVEDEEIGRGAVQGAPQEACAGLVSLARRRGGYDNITVAILRCRRTGEGEGVR